MTALGCVVLLFLALGGTAVAFVLHEGRGRRWLRRVATEVHAPRLTGGLSGTLAARGRRGDWAIEIAETRGGVVGTIEGTKLPGGLDLRPESLLMRAISADVETGDGELDRWVRVSGREELALAVFDAKARSALVAALVDGEVRLDRGGRLTWKTADLEQTLGRIDEMVELAEALRDPGPEIADRLARNAVSDPEPEVRLRNLRILQERYPGSAACRRASATALRSRRPAIRLRGAAYLAGGGPEEGSPGPDPDLGGPAAEALAELVATRGISEGMRCEALRSLARPERIEQALPHLERALRTGSSGLRQVAAEALGRARHRPAVALFAAALDDLDPRATATAAEALRRIADPAAEPLFLRLLEHSDVAVRLAAIRGLAEIGSATAVEALVARAEKGLGLSREAKAAAAAKFRIQTRLDGAEAGQLSLAELRELDGALSPARDAALEGAVSMGEGDRTVRGSGRNPER